MDRKFKSEKEYIIFKDHDVIIKLKNSVEGIDAKTFEAKLLDYNEAYGIKIFYEDKEFIIPLEKIHYTKLNDKIQINKNKGETND